MSEQHEDKAPSEKPSKFPTDPLDVVTRKFTPHRIVHEDRGFVIAVGEWVEPDDHPGEPPIPRHNAVAVRWHIPGEIGYPNGFGRPQWMYTPIDADRIESLDNPLLPHAVKITLLGDPRKVEVGGWVFSGFDWHLVTYVYGDGEQMVEACGLGKSGSYPISIDEITKSGEGRSTMDLWYTDVMGGQPCVWLDPRGVAVVTVQATPAMIWYQHNPGNVYRALEFVQAPVGDTWYSSDNRPAVFDYLMADHALLGQLDWAELSVDENPNELSMTKLRSQLQRFMQDIDVVAIYSAMKDEKLGDHRRHFVKDLSDSQKQTVFAHDVVMGEAYYDLRATAFVG
jgi:hypothetical protein